MMLAANRRMSDNNPWAQNRSGYRAGSLRWHQS